MKIKVLKNSELRSKSIDELKSRVTDLKKETMNLRFQKSAGQLESTERLRAARREVARIKTMLKEKSKNNV